MYSIELFTGGGGLALGTHRAGFHHVAAIERSTDSCDTLRLNVKNRTSDGVSWPVIESDVRTINYSTYTVPITLLAGGAPCQPFSLGGKHAGQADNRNMFPEVFRAIRALRPKAILLENVRGLVRETFRPYFNYILAQLALPHVELHADEAWYDHATRLEQLRRSTSGYEDERYDVAWELVNVADYGVPQERHRVFVVAYRHDLNISWSFPARTHSRDTLLYAQYVDESYWQEHGQG